MNKLITIFFVTLISTNLYAEKWYEGGTLHNATAIEWQSATVKNKLATCGDFVSQTWLTKRFKPAIQSKLNSDATLDSTKALSNELVKALDKAFEKDPDPEKNKKIYANITVGTSVAMLMVMMDWVEL